MSSPEKIFSSSEKIQNIKIKKKNFEFFLRYLEVYVPVPNVEKWYFSDLIPVLKVNLEYLE
jgi:hypothetical protein